MARTKMKNSPKKKQIINVAKDLFIKKWFEWTSMQNIIDKADTSKWWIYHYFSSKEEILDNIIKDELAPLCKEIKEIFENKNISPLEKLNLYIWIRSKFLEDKYDLLKQISVLSEYTMIKNKISHKIADNVRSYLNENTKEWINDWTFGNLPYPEEMVRLITWTFEYIFHFWLERINSKKELEGFLKTIDFVFREMFYQKK